MNEKEWWKLIGYIEWYTLKYVKTDPAYRTDLSAMALEVIEEGDSFDEAKRKAHNIMRADIKRKKYEDDKVIEVFGYCEICGEKLYRRGQKVCSKRCENKKYYQKISN